MQIHCQNHPNHVERLCYYRAQKSLDLGSEASEISEKVGIAGEKRVDLRDVVESPRTDDKLLEGELEDFLALYPKGTRVEVPLGPEQSMIKMVVIHLDGDKITLAAEEGGENYHTIQLNNKYFFELNPTIVKRKRDTVITKIPMPPERGVKWNQTGGVEDAEFPRNKERGKPARLGRHSVLVPMQEGVALEPENETEDDIPFLDPEDVVGLDKPGDEAANAYQKMINTPHKRSA